MQFVDVKGNGQYQAFSTYIVYATGKESCESHVLLGDPKYSFRLYGSVDPEYISFFACDVFKALFTVLIESL